MHSLNKIVIPYSFYNKKYIEETDTMEYTLTIKNVWYDILIKITIVNFSNYNTSNTFVEILSGSLSIYNVILTEKGQVEALLYVQDFLFEHNLLLYIDGFGITSFDKLYIEQSKPTTLYGYNYNSSNSTDR